MEKELTWQEASDICMKRIADEQDRIPEWFLPGEVYDGHRRVRYEGLVQWLSASKTINPSITVTLHQFYLLVGAMGTIE